MPFDAVTRAEFPSDVTTHLHLFRHGRVETGGRRLVYGHTDLPLTDDGRRQGMAAVDFAAGMLPRVAGVVSSDLGRCTTIARPLAARLRVPLVETAALREQFMGDWEGRAWADLNKEDPAGVHAYWDDYLDARPAGGETLRELADRVDAWWRDSLDELRGRRWVVVAHTGVVRVLCCRALGLPLAQALRFAPPPSSHTHLIHAEAGWVVQALGERVAPTGVGDHVASDAPTTTTASVLGPPRVALSGSAGTGKSTLGRALAARLGVPYLAEGMRARLEGGLDLHSLDHDAFRGLLWELWGEQLAAEREAIASDGGFVADRSALDFAAFWLHYHFTDDQTGSADFFAQTLGHAAGYDHVVLLPWGVLPLVADGVRNSNPWLQRRFQATLEGLVLRELAPPRLIRMPPERDLERRLAWVLTRIGAAEDAG